MRKRILNRDPYGLRLVEKPMHLQPVFGGKPSSKQKSVRSKQRYPARVVGGTIAEDLFNRGLCLPSGTAITNADLDRIIDTIREGRGRKVKNRLNHGASGYVGRE